MSSPVHNQAVTIVVGSGPDARMVRSSLVDMAALNLIQPVVWADAQPAAQASDLVELIRPLGAHPADSHSADSHGDAHPGAGLVSTVTLRQALEMVRREESARQPVQPVHFLVIYLDMQGDTAHGQPVSAEDLNVWPERIADIVGSHEAIDFVHLVVPDNTSAADIRRYGLATYIVAPEDAATPLAHREHVAYPYPQHTASVLASLAGLWETATSTPLISAATNSNSQDGSARLVRTFYRYIDASGAEAVLRDELLGVQVNPPNPVLAHGDRVAYARDDAALVAQTAEQLLQRHRSTFVSEALPMVAPAPKTRDAWKAIASFFNFFFRAVFGNASTWVQHWSASGQRALAKVVQDTLYGSDSNIEVLIGGHSGKRPPSVAEIEQDSGELLRKLEASLGVSSRDTAGDLQDFWRNYCNRALGLVDARSDRAEEATREAHRDTMIVNDTRYVVPPHSYSYQGRRPEFEQLWGDRKPQTTIAPYDSEGAQQYQYALQVLSRELGDVDLQAEYQAFQAWEAQNSRNFAWQVGQGLQGFLGQVHRKVQQAHAQIMENHAIVQDALDRGAAQRLARKLRRIAVVWAILMLLTVYLGLCHYYPDSSWSLGVELPIIGPVIEWLTWQRTLFIALAITLVSLSSQMIVFARGNRGLYDQQQRREAAAKNVDIAQRNFAQAIRELHALSGAYNQFTCWSDILGRVLDKPFGEHNNFGDNYTVPDSGLPHNAQIVEAEYHPAAYRDLVAQIRNKLYRRGWLASSFDEITSQALEQVNATNQTSVDVVDLFAQAGNDSELADVALICRQGSGLAHSAFGERFWKDCVAELNALAQAEQHSQSKNFVDKLVPRHDLDLSADYARLRQENRPSPRFLSDSVIPMAANGDTVRVDEANRITARGQGNGSFSESLVLVEFGHIAPLEHFNKSSSQATTSGDTAVPQLGSGHSPIPTAGDGVELF